MSIKNTRMFIFFVILIFLAITVNVMATDVKITDLTAKGVPTTTDNIPIVDNAGVPTTKKTTLGQLLNNGVMSLTGLSDVASSTKTSGNILVANGTNFVSVAISGPHGLAANGAFTNSFDRPMILAAPSNTNYGEFMYNNATLNGVSCFTDTGTATVDIRQCISGPGSGCNSLLNSTISCSTTKTTGSINSAASALTGGNYFNTNVSAVSGNPGYIGITRNINQ